MKRRRKLLLGITLGEPGGAQHVVVSLLSNLDPAEYDITVVHGSGTYLQEWIRKNTPWVKVIKIRELKREISPIEDLMVLIRLINIIKRGPYDIVHFHSSKMGILGRIAAYLVGQKKVIFTVHGVSFNEYQSPFLRYIYIMLERVCARISSDIVCVSEADRRKLLDKSIGRERKIKVITNGVAPVGERQSDYLGNKLFTFGWVGRFMYQKYPEFLLFVAHELVKKRGYTNIRFRMIGDGPLYENCQLLRERLGLGRYVSMPGFTSSIGKELARFDCLLHFSRWEGLPLTLLEAMSCGLPIVAHRTGGIGEIIVHNKTGILINKLDPSLACDHIVTLLRNPAKLERMGTRARKRWERYFTVNNMTMQYKKLYEIE